MSTTEDKITAWFAHQSKLSPSDFPIGIGDDMAQIKFGSESVFVTTDMLLDGVHFDLKKATLKQVGYKAMAVSLSDCAAMATVPVAAVVSVAMPKGFGGRELKQLHAGIVQAGDKYNCTLVGGDITCWKGKSPFAVNVAMLSKQGDNEPVKRSGAKVGDCICVTGYLGGSVHGRHLKFEPRIEEALKIAKMVTVNSMMDISDGLSSDLKRICEQSGVGAIVDAGCIPVSKQAGKTPNPLNSALNDGEDFELLFTLSHSNCKKLLSDWNELIPITQIGTVTDTMKMKIKMPDGRLEDLKTGGYEHLKD